MTVHRLKTHFRYWDEINAGNKTAELRFNDRDYQLGDVLELERVDVAFQPADDPPRIIVARVSHILGSDFTDRYGMKGIMPRWVMLSFRVEWKPNA